MSEFKAVVKITADTAEQAEQVLIERVNFDEEYGFDYNIRRGILITTEHLAELTALLNTAEQTSLGDSNDDEIAAWREAAEYAAELLEFKR